MRRLFVVFIATLFICVASVIADVPHMMNYQGYLTDTGGEPLDTTVAMTFSLYDAATLGTQLWTETQPACSVREGLFNVLLGSVNPIPDSAFDSTSVWLGITIGGDSEMEPRTRVASVAYAYRIGTVDGAAGGTVVGDLEVQGQCNFGWNNVNTGLYSFVIGTNDTALGTYSTVSGGAENLAVDEYATVGGGLRNAARGAGNTVGGGVSNTAQGGSYRPRLYPK